MRLTSAVVEGGLVLSFRDILYSLQVQIHFKRVSVFLFVQINTLQGVLTCTVAQKDTQSTVCGSVHSLQVVI